MCVNSHKEGKVQRPTPVNLKNSTMLRGAKKKKKIVPSSKNLTKIFKKPKTKGRQKTARPGGKRGKKNTSRPRLKKMHEDGKKEKKEWSPANLNVHNKSGLGEM